MSPPCLGVDHNWIVTLNVTSFAGRQVNVLTSSITKSISRPSKSAFPLIDGLRPPAWGGRMIRNYRHHAEIYSWVSLKP
jgi:hypothetical protein